MDTSRTCTSRYSIKALDRPTQTVAGQNIQSQLNSSPSPATSDDLVVDTHVRAANPNRINGVDTCRQSSTS